MVETQTHQGKASCGCGGCFIKLHCLVTQDPGLPMAMRFAGIIIAGNSMSYDL